MANLAVLDKTTPFAFSSESNSLYFQHNWPLATVGNMGGYFWKRKEIKKGLNHRELQGRENAEEQNC